jgi:hypothetical protein
MHLEEIGCEDTDYIYLNQDRGEQLSDSVEGEIFTEQVSDYQILRRDTTPCG